MTERRIIALGDAILIGEAIEAWMRDEYERASLGTFLERTTRLRPGMVEMREDGRTIPAARWRGESWWEGDLEIATTQIEHGKTEVVFQWRPNALPALYIERMLEDLGLPGDAGAATAHQDPQLGAKGVDTTSSQETAIAILRQLRKRLEEPQPVELPGEEKGGHPAKAGEEMGRKNLAEVWTQMGQKLARVWAAWAGAYAAARLPERLARFNPRLLRFLGRVTGKRWLTELATAMDELATAMEEHRLVILPPRPKDAEKAETKKGPGARHAYAESDRLKIVLEYERGTESLLKIAEKHNVSKKTLQRWRRDFKRRGLIP